MASQSTTHLPQPALSLNTIADEILLHILSFLDVPELLNTSRTTHHLRRLSLDPLLHAARLHHASLSLSRSIPTRPPLSELVNGGIYFSRNSLAARTLNRNLIKIKLDRLLRARPPAAHLVERNVLPDEYVFGRLAPNLISAKRSVEREKVKDALRGWVGEWRRRGEAEVRKKGMSRSESAIESGNGIGSGDGGGY